MFFDTLYTFKYYFPLLKRQYTSKTLLYQTNYTKKIFLYQIRANIDDEKNSKGIKLDIKTSYQIC